MDQYQLTLKEVTDMFESCGCNANVSTPSSSQVVLTIQGPVSICPSSIFEEHVERAKELMQVAYPNISFHVEVVETEL
ncbi:hypothetical protein KBD61_05640 [Patescibacteria group bacterium]|nr:hypothetical protein [Patescibacteria group bacterium]MBP9710470.1 hypothetical protein [Patescibacteria group bacterium]